MIRKANVRDPKCIMDLVNRFASRELMLPLPLSETYDALRDFYVFEQDGRIVGCAALRVSWEGLGEIRSVAVAEEAQGRGVGTALVRACIAEARQLGMDRVFVLTYTPEFFDRFGFRRYPKEKLPHKIWSDCLKCPKFPNCDEVAMLVELAEAE